MIFQGIWVRLKDHKILRKMIYAQLRTKTRTSISQKLCYVKSGFQILYAVEQFSPLFSRQFSLMQSNWVQNIFRKLRWFMTFLNKLNSARIGKIFARWHLAIAITSECIFLIALKTTTILSEKKKKWNKLLATKTVSRVRKDDKLKGKNHP